MQPVGGGSLVRHASGPRALHRLGSNTNAEYLISAKLSLPQACVEHAYEFGVVSKHVL